MEKGGYVKMVKGKHIRDIWIDEFSFSGLFPGQLLSLCLACETKVEAERLLARYRNYCINPRYADETLSVIFFTFANDDEKERLCRMFSLGNSWLINKCSKKEGT